MELRVKKNGTINFVIANNLIAYLEVAFEDPDKKITFQYKFQKLRQRDCAFLNYFADF